jgi:hypothetical protein
VVADFLTRLEAAAARWSLPLDALPMPDWNQSEPPALGWQGILLGQGVTPRPWIQKLEAPTVIMVPFAVAGATRPSWLMWAHEEVSRMKIADGTPQAARLETSVLTRDAARACAEVGLQYSTEGGGASCAWIHSGWGEVEDFALAQAREVFEDRLPVMPVEAASRQVSGPECRVWLGTAKTALPLARMIGTQCWLAFHRDSQRFVAQTISTQGSSMLIWAILDRLGYFNEAAQAWEEWVQRA